ncbi:unnamed protein product [Moneuplotes crassus]|uniref:Uncharacterized protein n=1 Tax=Euplotes crassus TaxID=5936 RepID=A0AAD2CVX3_EUPCR|nr:unnamed protein product [Moneuplotes crassus]
MGGLRTLFMLKITLGVKLLIRISKEYFLTKQIVVIKKLPRMKVLNTINLKASLLLMERIDLQNSLP